MTNLNQDKIIEALAGLAVLAELPPLQNLLSSCLINDGHVIVSFNIPAHLASQYEPLRTQAEQMVSALDGVSKVSAILTAERAPSAEPKSSSRGQLPQQAPIDNVKHIVAVASGKGGVGKSTLSANLALALKEQGLSVGLLDADIYGPSVPRMFGISGQPKGKAGAIEPFRAHGINLMSIGFMVDAEAALVWRGSMVIKALRQLLRDVIWGTPDDPLDVLIVDMPPGTGDAQLTMVQHVPLSGAVIVSTPQDIALIDARKGLNMFEKTNVAVLGFVENMSMFICPHCGERSDIFGHGGAREEAEKLGVPFLGEVPLHIDIRVNSDEGTPIVAEDGDGVLAEYFHQIAKALKAKLD